MALIIDFSEYHKDRKLLKIPSRRKRKRITIRAERQGYLDSLCGVYSIVNAISFVCKLTDEDKEQLFGHLIHILQDDAYVTKAILYGVCTRHIPTMLDMAVSHMANSHGLNLHVKPLFHNPKHVDLKAFWKKLRHFTSLSGKRSIILGLRGREDHWTCVRAITDCHMKLLDSCGGKQIRKQNCRIGKPYSNDYYHLIVSQVWGISFKD